MRCPYKAILVSLLVLALAGCSGADSAPSADSTDTSPDTTVADSTDVAEVTAPSDPIEFAYYTIPATSMVREKATACPANFQDITLATGQWADFNSADQTRSFYLALPDSSYSGPRPVFIGYHGTNGTGFDKFDDAKWNDFVERGMIVIAPDGNENGTIWPVWDAMRTAAQMDIPNADDIYVRELLDCMAAHLDIDEHRIYMGGHSAGGIMTNYMLQRHSDWSAGGIVASGVFALTTPAPELPLDPMAVVVTWGGDDDIWAGQAGDGPSTSVNFLLEAAIASQYFETSPGLNQTHCYGHELGHSWVDPANHWMIDFLLAHPNGLADNEKWEFTAVPEGTEATCSPDAAFVEQEINIDCEIDTLVACTTYCQLLADCVAENGTIRPIMLSPLVAWGFSASDTDSCSGCIEHCQEAVDQAPEIDEAILQCFVEQQATAQCGPGVPGAMPYINATNVCCLGQDDSPLCSTICAEAQKVEVLVNTGLVTGCSDWPED